MPVTAYAEADDVVTVTYDHATCAAADAPCVERYDKSVPDGRLFLVEIENTRPDLFTYEARGLVAIQPDAVVGAAAGGAKPRETHRFYVPHSARFAGYVIKIRPQDSAKTDGLASVDLIVEIRPSGLQLSFGGGFALGLPGDTAYGLRDSTITAEDGTTSSALFVREESDRADALTRGVATFIHLSDPRWKGLGASFGLGLDPNNLGQDYYLGVSLVSPQKAAFTLGVNAHSAPTLPAGVNVGERVADANALNNLGSRVRWTFFVAFSYNFLGGDGARLAKPFAEPDSP
ncbi:MAG: hypothetical protein AAFP15_05105 [Bacteroidota bacterium]